MRRDSLFSMSVQGERSNGKFSLERNLQSDRYYELERRGTVSLCAFIERNNALSSSRKRHVFNRLNRCTDLEFDIVIGFTFHVLVKVAGFAEKIAHIVEHIGSVERYVHTVCIFRISAGIFCSIIRIVTHQSYGKSIDRNDADASIDTECEIIGRLRCRFAVVPSERTACGNGAIYKYTPVTAVLA